MKLLNSDILNIAVIDDDSIFQILIKSLLEENPNLRIKLQCRMGQEFFNSYHQLRVDVIILDLDIPGEDGFQIAKRLSEECPEIPVVVFSTLDHDRYRSILYSLGVKKCIVKNQFPRLEREILELFSNRQQKQQDASNLDIYEQDLLMLVCEGNCIDRISDKLNVGPEAAKKRKAKLAEKIRIENKDIHFLKWAVKHGYYVIA